MQNEALRLAEANENGAATASAAGSDGPPAHVIDIRPLVASGGEPFLEIMNAVDVLAPTQRLRLIAPFRPVPLFAVMARRGYRAEDRALPSGEGWDVLFTPIPRHRTAEPTAAAASDAMFWPDPVANLDLAGVPPPHPMARILKALQEVAPGQVLFAVLDREPTPLFEELAKHGHEWIGDFSADRTAYRMMIRRGGGGSL